MVTFTKKDCRNSRNRLRINSFLQQFKFYLTLLTISAFYIPPLLAQPIGQPGTAGDFEIDANFRVNTNFKDWRSVLKQSAVPAPGGGFYVLPGISTVAGENAVWIIDGNSGIGTEKEVLSTGSNKNGNPIGANQSPYTIVTVNPSSPQKNDLTNIYARSKIISGKRWIQLAAETRSVDGTSYLDFEYNQAGTNQTATQLIGLGPDAGRTAKKIVNGKTLSGDLLFVVDFSKGGNAPIPEVYEWQASTKSKSGFDWVKLPLPATTYIVTNGSDVETAGENSGFKGDGTPSNTTLALQLVEIGVDLTTLGIVDDNVCKPNATLTAKTRTSSSYTSELKDFNSFKFALVPPASMVITEPLTKCEEASAEFEATVIGDGALASNVKWYKMIGTAPNFTDSTEITSGITTNTTTGQKSILTISSVTSGNAGTYRAWLSNATCGRPSATTTLTVNTTATLTNLAPQVKCPGTTVTATFSTTVGGTDASAANVEWYFGTTKIVHDGVKYTISTSGSVSTLLITGIDEADEGNYKAKLTGAACGTPEKSNSLTVNETATMQDLSPQKKCPGENETATFTATVGGTDASAANVEWYFGTTKLSNGTKYTISTDGMVSTLVVKNIVEADEGNYKAKLTGAACGTPEKSNSLTVNPVPVADAGPDPDDQCFIATGNAFTLDGSKSANGTPLWTVVSQPEGWIVEFLNSSNTTLTANIKVTGKASGGKVVLKLTITSDEDPSCGIAEDEVEVEILAQPAGPNAEMLPITCSDKTFKLKVLSPVTGVTYSLTQPGNSKEFTPIKAEAGKDVIFEGLLFGDGYSVVATIGDCSSAPSICTAPNDKNEEVISNNQKVATSASDKNSMSDKITVIDTKTIKLEGSSSKVSASPNPFNSTIRFKLESNVSGQGSLELYNMMGQKVKTVYSGYIMKGQTQTIDYSVPGSQRTNLIWVFSVGSERMTGKLVNLK